MATLTVLKFDSVDEAKNTIERINRLQAGQLLAIEDAATLLWSAGSDRDQPGVCRIHQLGGSNKLMAVFWHLLFGFLFVPWSGARSDSPRAALGGAFSEFGIDQHFVRRVREWIPPGTSALFLFTRLAITERLAGSLQNLNLPCQMMVTHLTAEKANRLREVFATPAESGMVPARWPAEALVGSRRFHSENEPRI